MTNTITTIQNIDLIHVCGGEGESPGFLSRAGSAISTGVDTVRNFGNGFAAGATFGPNARTENVERYGNSSQTGFKPGVETGMMFNMAAGPVGRLWSAAANRVPGSGGG